MSYQAALHPRIMASPRRPAAVVMPYQDTRYNALAVALVWTLLILMIVPEGFNYAMLASSKAEAAGPLEGSALTRALWLGLLGVSGVIVMLRVGLLWHVLRSFNPFFLLFVALAVASLAWSIDATLTTRRLIRLMTMVMVALAFALVAWHRTRYQALVRSALTVVLGCSIVFGLLFPDYAIHHEASSELTGAWRGLSNHKNTFGALSAIATIFWAHAWLSREVRGWQALAGGAITVTTLLLSRSTTSLVTAIFVVGFLAMLMRMPHALRPYQKWLVGLFVLALVMYTLIVLSVIPGKSLFMGPIMALTGKDYALTGRHDIWAIIIEHIRWNPVLGGGFGAYWAGPVASSPSYDFVLRMWFYPGSAHNGYLDMLNDLGAAGLLILIGYVLTHVRQCLQLLHTDRAQASLLLAIFFQQAVSNLSETHWLNVMNVDFVIVTLASAALARALFEERLRRHYAPAMAAAAAAAQAAQAVPEEEDPSKAPGPPEALSSRWRP